MNRTQNAIRNIVYGIISKIAILLSSFVARTVFIRILGTTYLGVNGLFTEVLSLLSFAELGFGSAMAFTMYKPIVEKDDERIITLLTFYKKVYRCIAMVILLIGLCVIPFLDKIIKDADWLSLFELKIYFSIYLFNTVVGYFVVYKFTYLNALQKNYIQTNFDSIVTIASYIFQIIIILRFENFLYYLLTNSLVIFLSRVFVVIYLNKKYPILRAKTKSKIDKSDKEKIFNEVKGLAVHQFSSAAVHSTDNLLISSFISVVTVGLISNYTMLMNSVLGFLNIIFNSLTGGFGNLAFSSSTEKFHKVFKEINFANFWIYSFCSIAFWALIPPFITIWIGEDKLIDNVSFFLLVVCFYIQGQNAMYNIARSVKGEFNRDKWYAVLQAVLNLVFSIIFTTKLGLVGIYLGTIVSRMVYIIFRPYTTYLFLFNESSKVYYKTFFTYFCMFIIGAVITKFLVIKVLTSVTIKTFIYSIIIVLVVPNLIFYIMSIRSVEFKSWKMRLSNIIKGVYAKWKN